MNESVGEIIAKARESKGLSKRELSRLAKISDTELARIESGEREIPNPKTLRKISKHIDVNYNDLMYAAGLGFQVTNLNPFLREAYLIKYGSNDPATIVTGKDVFTKRADATPNYAGKQAGVIVLTESGDIVEREGSFVLPKETLVGGWAKVFIKGHDTPEYASVSLDEYIGRKKNGEINGQWSKKPATMIRKVAVVQALREAFPDRFQGMYAQEEMTEVSGIKLDTEKIVEAEIIENANTVEFVEEEETEIVDAEVVEEDTETELPDFMKQE